MGVMYSRGATVALYIQVTEEQQEENELNILVTIGLKD